MLKSTTAMIAACAALYLTSGHASAEVIKEGDGGFVTRDAAVVKAAPFDAWQALITPSKWWNSSHTWSADAENLYISPQGGGCFCELLPVPKGAPETIRRGSAQHMVVVLADPGRVLRMRGGLGPLQSEPVQGVLTITLTPSDKGTVIVFEYVVGGYMRFETPEIAKAVDGVMSQQLAGLAKLLGPVTAASAKGKAAKPADDPAPDGSDEAEPGDEPRVGASDAKPAPKKPSTVDEAFGPMGDE
ncbi:SRPBCC family protein [Allopontixanthobacter sediminis]|uniref:SRPBCC family protein n=1 Tax=Allopontixanthobacter sediminis TaxID=1689985 RepID=A0A845AYJ1_9SPHN|nr:SRPBCC family protein [Allopontixanthobacter sediminis]MXP43300.1 SRPBCC family protein [Allopontixanthobacter sediminis]